MDEQQKVNMTIHFRGNPQSVTFEDIIGYQLGSGFLGVMVGNTTYIYPSDTIDNVIHTVKE